MSEPLRAYIETPCPMKWSDMKGDDRKRFCGQCKLRVHNTLAMTTEEVAALLEEAKTERRCATLYRRSDGTLVTGDCRVRWQERKKAAAGKLGEAGTIAAVVFGFIAFLGISFVLTMLLFGDDLRRYFGSSAGALAGTAPTATASKTFTR